VVEPTGPQRRRGAALETAILDATWAELSEVGYQRLTMEGVAARAQTGKQVLYRRWRNRAELVMATVRRQVTPISRNLPDTGRLRDDVLVVLRRMSARYTEIGPDIVHGLMMEASDLGPDFYGLLSGMMTTILGRAAERGEARPGPIPSRVVSLPLDLVRHEMMLAHRPVPEAALAEIVDQLFLPLVSPTGPTGPTGPTDDAGAAGASRSGGPVSAPG
jgi:AcrR family transcriptional regulator